MKNKEQYEMFLDEYQKEIEARLFKTAPDQSGKYLSRYSLDELYSKKASVEERLKTHLDRIAIIEKWVSEEEKPVSFRGIRFKHPEIEKSLGLEYAFMDVYEEYVKNVTDKDSPLWVEFQIEHSLYSSCPKCNKDISIANLGPAKETDEGRCPHCGQLLEISMWVS